MAVHHSNKRVNIIKPKNVVAVDKDSVTVKSVNRETKTEETVKVPFGVCVWSTGGAPHPLINMLRTKLKGQNNTRALITDNSLAVNGAKDVWAVGDCATMDQGKFINKAVVSARCSLFTGDMISFLCAGNLQEVGRER
jgi:NADH dehydrogenase FAD-containing subunit